MKQTLYIIVLLCSTLFFGCNSEEDSPVPTETRVELRGSLQAPGITTRGDGMIHPILNDPADIKGIPPNQLEVGIVTIEFGSITNSNLPTTVEWNDPTTYLDRGFFGGNIPNDHPDNYTGNPSGWTGNIEYTNRDGDAIQQLFYDGMGIYYYMVVVYPYESIDDIENVDNDGTIIKNSSGASVAFNVDGSQDIMASTMGGGNIEHPFRESLTFSHKLTALRCHFVAESELAETRYGKIISVELVDQPKKIGLNIGKQANSDGNPLFNANTNLKIDYPAVGAPNELTLPYPLDETPVTPAEYGYMLAMPAKTYKFRIVTEKRNTENPLYVTYDFDPQNSGVMPAAGTIYNLTFTMLETIDIELEAAEAEGWTFEQTFD